MSTTIPSQAEYEARELNRARKHYNDIQFAPLQARKDGRRAWREALQDKELIAERVSWLMNGSYGFGEMMMAKQATASRGNNVARMAHLIAGLEWQCPTCWAGDEWNKLPLVQRNAVNAAIQSELDKGDWAA
jgi:hypothetical protein